MYEAYWQLERRPFENTSDPRFYYPAETHQGALLKLRYVLESRRGAALLAGPPGSGKSLLIEILQRQLGKEFSPFVHLVFPLMPTADLLGYLADELGAPTGGRGSESVQASVERIQRFLDNNARASRHAVIAVDEAHLLADNRTFEALRLLLNFEHGESPSVGLLIVGNPSLLPALDRMGSLEERMGVKCLLRPFTLEETISYVSQRLKAAGARHSIFEPDALEAMHELSGGLPRRINRLGDLALLIGFAEESRSITAGQLEAVSNELVRITAE